MLETYVRKKEKLRNEIKEHIEIFLHNGGKIKILKNNESVLSKQPSLIKKLDSKYKYDDFPPF